MSWTWKEGVSNGAKNNRNKFDYGGYKPKQNNQYENGEIQVQSL